MDRLQGKFSNIGEENVEIDIPIIIFEDQGVWFYYAPSLDVTGYGNTKEEHKKFSDEINLFTSHLHDLYKRVKY